MDKEGRNLTNWREDQPGCGEIEINSLLMSEVITLKNVICVIIYSW